MPDYTTYAPGVYVEEVQTGTRPIQTVGTSTAGFIGWAPKDKWKKECGILENDPTLDSDIRDSHKNEVQNIISWTQFRNLYFPPETLTKTKPADVGQAPFQHVAAQLAAVQQTVAQLKAAKLEADRLEDPKLGAKKLEANKEETEKLKVVEKEAAQLADAHLEVARLDADKLAVDLQAAAKLADAQSKLAAAKTAVAMLADQPGTVDEADAKLAAAKQAFANLAAALQAATKQAADQQAAAEQVFPDRYWTPLAHAVYGFFLNGGSECYVYNVGADDADLGDALEAFSRVDDIAILAAPGRTDDISYGRLIDACENLNDRVAILDGPQTITGTSRIVPLLGGKGEAWKEGDPWKPPRRSERGFATLYTPWLKVANPNPEENKDPKKRSVPVPPSGYIAGIWARSDATRGVHKAPANEAVRGVLDLEYNFSDTEQGGLNTNGVNCIRYFSNTGNLVWGARTLFPPDKPLWKYLNVRRLFNQIEESILKGTRWIVFEPNDRPLWQAIKRDITAFLMGFWRAGALMGATPEEAFFVKCDEENNPFDEIVKGYVHIDIGIAPVRPAEFVVFRIAQYEAGSEVNVSGE